jgi:hypothetical protein
MFKVLWVVWHTPCPSAHPTGKKKKSGREKSRDGGRGIPQVLGFQFTVLETADSKLLGSSDLLEDERNRPWLEELW